MSYIDSINRARGQRLLALESKAKKDDVPIILDETYRFLSQIIRLKGAQTVLELGTAIGYNAIRLCSDHPFLRVSTIERDKTMIEAARKNIAEINMESRIELIEGDALEIDTTTLGTFDLVFIDAAKAQNIKFFEKYERHLNAQGVIVVDNVLFHDMITKRIRSRNLRQLIRKIDAFNQYVMQRDDFDSAIHPLGDGVCVSIKRQVKP